MATNRRIESIVFLERNTFTIDFRRPAFAHEWIEYGETAPEEIVPRLRDATIAICNKLPMREDVVAQLPKLRLIAVAATGVDNIDLAFCRSRGIGVCNVRGYAASSLPEHALMLMLCLRRNLIAYRGDVQSGRWQTAKQYCLIDHPINDLQGTTLGVVGYGTLGQSMARLARSIGVNVLVAERKGAVDVREGRTSFSDVLRLSDVLSLHCPLTEETRNLIGAPEIQQMKPEAILINTARGGLVDAGALLQSLIRGLLGGAGIDVLITEPPRDGNVLLETSLPNLIVTPHNAWASRQAMQILGDQLVDSLEAFVSGGARNLVT
jgi:glycerate dehydrogenase